MDQGRYWTDADGIHHEAANGQRIDLKYLPEMRNGNVDASPNGWTREMLQRPGELPYMLIVDGQFQGVIWIPQGNGNIQFGPPPTTPALPAPQLGGGTGTDPYEIALDILEHLPMPPIDIRMNPALGLVAMPGWFWVEGYNGAPFGMARTVTIPPVAPGDEPEVFTVEVRVWPSRYEWTFGDGGTLVTESLGKPYPAESDVRHTYEYSSLPFANGFPVQLMVEFAAEFRVDGGPPQALPPIQRIFRDDYRVQEIQTVLTNSRSLPGEQRYGNDDTQR
ncbi:MAG: hypothetical protein NTZ05_07650 [Chloroflexi bacterium]|nr:hypothetical protein [Chloroflexota bacterium]